MIQCDKNGLENGIRRECYSKQSAITIKVFVWQIFDEDKLLYVVMLCFHVNITFNYCNNQSNTDIDFAANFGNLP